MSARSILMKLRKRIEGGGEVVFLRITCGFRVRTKSGNAIMPSPSRSAWCWRVGSVREVGEKLRAPRSPGSSSDDCFLLSAHQEHGASMARHSLFRTKALKELLGEMAGEHRLRRALGPVSRTGVGRGSGDLCGNLRGDWRGGCDTAGRTSARRVRAVFAGLTAYLPPSCYAEFASMAPVAGTRLHIRLCDPWRIIRMRLSDGISF